MRQPTDKRKRRGLYGLLPNNSEQFGIILTQDVIKVMAFHLIFAVYKHDNAINGNWEIREVQMTYSEVRGILKLFGVPPPTLGGLISMYVKQVKKESSSLP